MEDKTKSTLAHVASIATAIAAFNIQCRRDRVIKSQSDYDRKRLKMKKLEGDLRW